MQETYPQRTLDTEPHLLIEACMSFRTKRGSFPDSIASDLIANEFISVQIPSSSCCRRRPESRRGMYEDACCDSEPGTPNSTVIATRQRNSYESLVARFDPHESLQVWRRDAHRNH